MKRSRLAQTPIIAMAQDTTAADPGAAPPDARERGVGHQRPALAGAIIDHGQDADLRNLRLSVS